MNLKSKKIGVIIAAIVGGTIIAGGSCVGCVACVAGMTSNSDHTWSDLRAACRAVHLRARKLDALN